MQTPLSVEKCQNVPQMGVEGHMQVVRPSLFIPKDVRVVLSAAAREGFEFHPQKESFQPTFLPVTSYITATKVHQLNRANFSRRCQNTRGNGNGCVVSPSHFTLRKLSWRRRATLKWFSQSEQVKWQNGKNTGIWKIPGQSASWSLTFLICIRSSIIPQCCWAY